jgi:tetratricopeptide (TPR) repeat protein
MSKYGRRRRQRKVFLGNFYLNSNVQYLTTVVSAIALAGFVFSGFLLFRFTDQEDLINQGRLQLMEGKVAWAAQTFQTLVNHHPDSYEGHLLLGQAFLQLDERHKAEQEFQLAASLKNKMWDHAPEIALSKVAMAQNDFPKAEKIVYEAWKRNRQDENTKQALFELYEQWGDTLTQSGSKDYANIVNKYKAALRFVNDYQTQENVKDKLIESIHTYTEHLIAENDLPGAIRNLKISLRFRYTPETLIQIAELYGRMNQTDASIDAYRQAFDISPNLVGLRLTNVLIQKGQQLVEAKKPDEARTYFEEADKISHDAKVPMDNLYPVTLSQVKIKTDTDSATGEFSPTVTLKVTNDSGRDLNYLAVKAEYLSDEHLLGSGMMEVATSENPLKKKSEKNSTTIVLKPDSDLNIHAVSSGKLMIRISIAYQQGGDAVWHLKSIQEAVIPNTQPTPPAEPKPV